MKRFSPWRGHPARRLFPLVLTALLSLPAQAILDTNSNDLSDLWEREFNNNQLFPLTFDPQADPDGDGWTNEQESAAGTNPFQANPPDGIIRPEILHTPATYFTSPEGTELLTPEAFTITWPTLTGKKYTLYASPDLTPGSWLSVGPPLIAAGGTTSTPVSITQSDGSTPEKLFWRVTAEDTHTDTDGLTNAEEHVLGTDPTLIDSDSDQLSDQAEVLANLDPLNFDSDYDGIPDGTDATPRVNNAQTDPDGENLPTALNDPSKLIGRWDFEAYDNGIPSGLASTPVTVGAFQIANTNVTWDGMDNWAHEVRGMPWAAVHFTANGAYGKLPAEKFDGQNTQTWAMWVKFPASALDTAARKRTLFSFGAYTNHSDGSRLPHLHCYFDPSNQTLRMDKYNVAGWAQTPLASWPIPANLDDGQWHHIAIAFSSGSYALMMDGLDYGTVSNPTTFNLQLIQTSSSPYALIGRFTGAAPPYNFEETLGASIDRLRIYNKKLTIADETALYQQDIDRDGLPDRIEARRRGWRDSNHDNVRDASETYHIINPFKNQRPTDDSDRDGLADLHEYTVTQTDPADPDSDDDRLPDGWEIMHGLNPLNTVQPDTNGDPDGDLVSNFLEYCHGSSPVLVNTDGGPIGDKDEIDQGTNPADASDDDQPPPEGYLYSLTLGIGDQSGSHSEDYNLVVYEYDWSTGTETERFRLLSGGFGQYTETSLHFFDPFKTYTFKIEWVDSKYAGTTEGPDFDYTLKIEPASPDPTLELTDSFDLPTRMVEPGYQLRGVKSDFPNFLITTETKRVLANTLKIDLAVDNNMNRRIESLPEGMQAGQGWQTSKTDDRDYENNNPLHAVVIDVNNNNTDKGSGSATKEQVDNRNTLLDTEADKTELTADIVGHSFGTLRVWASPLSSYGIPWRGGIKTKFLRLSLPEQGADQIVRVFNWRGYPNNSTDPIELLGPGKTSYDFVSNTFFGKTEFAGNESEWKRDLLVEGLTYGTVKIRLEVIDMESNQVIASDDTYVTVNVDRCEQPPALVADNKDARVLGGVSPHHIGARKSNLGSASGIRAIRGKIVARVPSRRNGSATVTQLSPMRGRQLRQQLEPPQQDASASIWLGLKQALPSGDYQWIQTGLLWRQESDKTYASIPAAYLESGDYFQGKATNLLKLAASSDDPQFGKNLVPGGAPPLAQWFDAPVNLSFVMFKKPVNLDSSGADDSTEPWRVIYKDERSGINPGDGLYFSMSAAVPSTRPGMTDSQMVEMEMRYRNQRFRQVDAVFETNLSISFAPGKSSEKAVISDLNISTQLSGTAAPMPTTGASNEVLFLWAINDQTFDWTPIAVGGEDIIKEVKSGRSDAVGKPEDGTSAHPQWNVNAAGGSLEIWDTRSEAFEAPN